MRGRLSKDRLIKEADNKSRSPPDARRYIASKRNGAACVGILRSKKRYRLLVNASISAIGGAADQLVQTDTQKYRIQRGDLRVAAGEKWWV